MANNDYITFKGEPSDDSEVNAITINLNDYPQLAKLKREELAECGMSEEDIEDFMKDCKIDLELFYHKGSGLFGVESGAVESCPKGGLYSPYDGETELIAEEEIEPTDEEEQAFYEENKYNGEIVRTIDTLDWGEVDMVSRFDIDEGVTFYDCYQKNGGGYLGEFHTENLDALSDKEIEDDLSYNLDL